jgi:ATP-dependent DNA ligase
VPATGGGAKLLAASERSGAWIKLRANLEQGFVIGGYIPGKRGFDALLVGVYENTHFRREGIK